MNPGLLDRRIDLRTATTTTGATGQPIETFATLAASIPARKVETTGSEDDRDGNQRAVGQTVWIIRFRSDITTTGRVLYDGTEYDVEFTKEIGRRAYLELHTKRRTE